MVFVTVPDHYCNCFFHSHPQGKPLDKHHRCHKLLNPCLDPPASHNSKTHYKEVQQHMPVLQVMAVLPKYRTTSLLFTIQWTKMAKYEHVICHSWLNQNHSPIECWSTNNIICGLKWQLPNRTKEVYKIIKINTTPLCTLKSMQPA